MMGWNTGAGVVPVAALHRADAPRCEGTSRPGSALLTPGSANHWCALMFLQLEAVRKLVHRYLRRFVAAITSVDALRLTRRLEARVPYDLKGPATRAIVHNTIVDLARRHGVPVSG